VAWRLQDIIERVGRHYGTIVDEPTCLDAPHHTRRSARVRATNDHTIKDWLRQSMLRTTERCAYCQRAMPYSHRVIDHVIPLALGGAHSVRNIVVCCWACNVRKGAKLPAQWRAELSQERR
jgi:5-methylcytosine-specific restriction endonuclease McrA